MEPISKLWPTPRDLTGAGRKLFNEAGKILVEQRKLYELDKTAFVHMCKTHSIVSECQKDLVEHGVSIPSPQQGLKKNPASTILKSEETTLMKYFEKFYLTPQDREGIDFKEKPKKNQKEKFFKVA